MKGYIIITFKSNKENVDCKMMLNPIIQSLLKKRFILLIGYIFSKYNFLVGLKNFRYKFEFFLSQF